MKLTVYFYDAKGLSLHAPESIVYPYPLDAYAAALRTRTLVEAKRGVPVYLHTVEER